MGRLPLIYLPIELGAREFLSKALLATVLVSRGYSVVIGPQWIIAAGLARFAVGAVLFKNFNLLYHQTMREAKKAGHMVVVLEEELLAHMEKQAIGNYCVEGIFDLPHLILANGDFEKDTLNEFSGGRAKIEVTGNGRVDILKPGYRAFFKKEIEAIRDRFGDFILINTNFGLINSEWVDLETVKNIHINAGLKLDDPVALQMWDDQIEFEQLNKAGILTAIKELSRRRPKQRIVVRPHPGEALERWGDLIAGLPNVSVVREGAHVPWTLASQLLLHTSCTTGFEAQAAGKTAFSLVMKPSWLSQSFISNYLNPLFTDPIALVDATEAYLDRKETPPQSARVDPTYYIWNFFERSGVEKIADALTRELPPPAGVMLPFPKINVPEMPEKLRKKFSVSHQDCADIFQRMAALQHCDLALTQLADSLFIVGPGPKPGASATPMATV